MSVEKIQRALRGLGLYHDKIDGVSGSSTKDAIRKFQRINPPLVVDGVAGPKTRAELFVAPFGDRDRDDDQSVLRKLGQLKAGEFPRMKDVESFYGPVGRNQKRILLPYKMKLAWDTGKTISGFSCHVKVARPMQSIFLDTLEYYGLDAIERLGLDLFGGCLNVRKMRGGTRHSMHSWGIAVDLDPARNRLRWDHKKAVFARTEYYEFWNIVERHGAVSLGRERDYDWMHFQFARL